jgi:hypothetical protein
MVQARRERRPPRARRAQNHLPGRFRNRYRPAPKLDSLQDPHLSLSKITSLALPLEYPGVQGLRRSSLDFWDGVFLTHGDKTICATGKSPLQFWRMGRSLTSPLAAGCSAFSSGPVAGRPPLQPEILVTMKRMPGATPLKIKPIIFPFRDSMFDRPFWGVQETTKISVPSEEKEENIKGRTRRDRTSYSSKNLPRSSPLRISLQVMSSSSPVP